MEHIINQMLKSFILIIFLITGSPVLTTGKTQITWGRLANAGYENLYIKSIFFFAGNWRNGIQFYEYNPSNNTGLYTEHPSDSRHLGWSESQAYRDFALNEMIMAGFNVINMSYWGPRGTDNWAYWAPMQTSTYAHDELFNTALDKKILVAPYIESYAATDSSAGFSFADSFPGDTTDPDPQLIVIIEDLVDRYLVHPANSRWPEVWARAYDQEGKERYIISLIHVASNQAGMDIQHFASGFDYIANRIFDDTGIQIGFLLDALPESAYAPGNIKITPENAEPWLSGQMSLLGIQCFIPEIWTGYDTDTALIVWKRNFSRRWNKTSIPFIMDVSPGYDASLIFPGSMVYGNNQTWRDSISAIVEDIPAEGITVNTWNGYTEGFAVVPTLESGSSNYNWINGLCKMYTIPDVSVINATQNPGNKIISIYPNPFHEGIFVKSRNYHFPIPFMLWME